MKCRPFVNLQACRTGTNTSPANRASYVSRHLLERHKLADQILATVNALLQAKGLQLKAGTVVDGTLIAAPTSTKSEDKARDPEMHQRKKSNEWSFGMKAHIGVMLTRG